MNNNERKFSKYGLKYSIYSDGTVEKHTHRPDSPGIILTAKIIGKMKKGYTQEEYHNFLDEYDQQSKAGLFPEYET